MHTSLIVVDFVCVCFGVYRLYERHFAILNVFGLINKYNIGLHLGIF